MRERIDATKAAIEAYLCLRGSKPVGDVCAAVRENFETEEERDVALSELIMTRRIGTGNVCGRLMFFLREA